MTKIINLLFLAFCLNCSAGVVSLNMEFGQQGMVPTALLLNQNSLGDNSIGSWIVSPDPVQTMTISTNFNTELNGTRSISQLNTKNRQMIEYILNTKSSKAAVIFDMKLGNFTGSTYGSFDLAALDGEGEFAVLNFQDFPGAEFMFQMHTQAGVSSSKIPATANKRYRCYILWDKANLLATLKMYDLDNNTNLVGTSTLVLQNHFCQLAAFGRYDAHASVPSTINYFDNIYVDNTGSITVTNLPQTTNTPPVVTNTPPVITNTPPVVTNTPPTTNSSFNGKIINSASLSRADFVLSYNSAVDGDTIVLPVGSNVWTAGVSISKRIRILGSGSNSTILTFSTPNQTESFFIITKDGAELGHIQLTGVKGQVKGRGIEISASNCRIHHAFLQQWYWGAYLQKGFNLIDHSRMLDCQKFVRNHGDGAGTINWNYSPLAFNSPRYAVIEYCDFENDADQPDTGTMNAFSSQQGASWILRHCKFKLYKYFYGPVFDAHGNIDPGLRGVVSIQIYDNTIEFTGGGGTYKFVDFRGGGGRISNNILTGANSVDGIYLREEDYPGPQLTPPYTDPVNGVWIWGNKQPSGDIPIIVSPDDVSIIRKGVEYFDYAPSPLLEFPDPHPLDVDVVLAPPSKPASPQNLRIFQ